MYWISKVNNYYKLEDSIRKGFDDETENDTIPEYLEGSVNVVTGDINLYYRLKIHSWGFANILKSIIGLPKGYIFADPERAFATVGWVMVCPKLKIMNMHVYPDYRRRGLSKQMVKIAVEEFGATFCEVKPGDQVSKKVFTDSGFTTRWDKHPIKSRDTYIYYLK